VSVTFGQRSKHSQKTTPKQQEQQDPADDDVQSHSIHGIDIAQHAEAALEGAAASTSGAVADAADAVAGGAGAIAGAADAAAVNAAGSLTSAPEAVQVAGQQLVQEPSEYTEVEELVPVRTVHDYIADSRTSLTSGAAGKGLLVTAAAVLGGTLLVAVYRAYEKTQTVRAQRIRTVDKNKRLVDDLSGYLPSRRTELTPAIATKIRRSSGFSAVEVFRKYLWYLLREHTFDPDAVADMVQLKVALGLTDEDVAEALRERAQRIYDKYGTLMLNTEGMTNEGIERKATCQALVRKLLYLTEYQPLVAEGSEAFKTTDLRMIFGATDEDLANLRIESLVSVDVDSLTRMMGKPDADSDGEGEANQSAKEGGHGGSSSGSTSAQK